MSLRKGYAVEGRSSIVSGRAAIRMSLIRRGGKGPEPEQMLTIQTAARRRRRPHRRRGFACIRVCEQRCAAINIRPTPASCLYAKHRQLGDICRDTIASISKRQGLETRHWRFLINTLSNGTIIRWRARTVEVMKSVSKVVVVERKRICLADSGGLQLLKGDCGGWKEGGERNIFLGEFKEREGGSEAIRFQRKFARG